MRYILLDDASDPTTGAKIVNRFSTEERVDVIIGSSTVPVAIARLVAEIFVRLPGIYFAIGTLGFAFVVEGVARAFPSITGGASGLSKRRCGSYSSVIFPPRRLAP